MSSEKTSFKVKEKMIDGLRWLVWKPYRLVVAIIVLFLALIAVGNFGDSPQVEPTPTPTSTIGGFKLPDGWETWPTVDASPR